MTQDFELRRKELAAIHVAAKNLALAEDSYRALVERFSGGRTDSAGAMEAAERTALLEHFRSLGFERAKPGAAARGARRADVRPHARKLRALWLSLWQLGHVHDASEAALASFLERHTGLDALQFADVTALNVTIEHLKEWCLRVGFDPKPFRSIRPTPQEGSFRPALIRAQWDRLVALGVFRHGMHARLDTWMVKRGYLVGAPEFLSNELADKAIAELGRWIRQAQAKAERHDADRNVLPGILGEVARVAGLPAALALAREYGGQNHYFPQTVRASDRLAKLIGVKAARLLCGRLGGKRYAVPAARAALRWYEAHALRHNEGLSYSEIARRINLTRRYVIHLLEDEGAPPVPSAAAPHRTRDPAAHCPFCGHRHRAHAPDLSDPRQLALPL